VGIANPEQRIDEYPFQLSGGMRQRAMIAMALACNPRLLIADEPTTALDVTIQAQVLRLIKRMQAEHNLSLILITHDLGIVAHMVNYVYVVYLGYVLEAAPVREVFKNPRHPYTMDLLRSIPTLKGIEGRLRTIKGSVPSAYDLPTGCPFHPRCEKFIGNVCKEVFPSETEVGAGHIVSCHLYTKEGTEQDAGNAG
jgi:peptide/nickel transport system ATP-binding protein